MKRTFLCTLCPNGCQVEAEALDGQLLHCSGNHCARGEAYVRQELLAPMRTLSTTVAVRGGATPLCPVRITAPIPKARLFDAVREIHRHHFQAPVAAGQILVENLLGLGVDVIAIGSVSTGNAWEF